MALVIYTCHGTQDDAARDICCALSIPVVLKFTVAKKTLKDDDGLFQVAAIKESQCQHNF